MSSANADTSAAAAGSGAAAAPATNRYNVDPWVQEQWNATIVPMLSEYIKVPNLSPSFDPEFATNGHQEVAARLIVDWIEANKPRGATVQMLEEPGKTPFIVVDIPASKASMKGTCLCYAHMDKQPPLGTWSEGLGPTIPVIRERFGQPCLYGRGGADDGYGGPAAICAINLLQRQNIDHSRIIVIIEGCEESGSADLPFWLERTQASFGDVDFVICLDSGCQNYDQLWLTDSLRGILQVQVDVECMHASIHSGIGGGVCPDPMRIFRILLDRCEDSATGQVRVPSLQPVIPDSVPQLLAPMNDVPEAEFMEQFNFNPGVTAPPHLRDNVSKMIATSWHSSLTVIGYDTLPPCNKAGNVIREKASMKLSFRMPPTARAAEAGPEVKRILEADPPCNARVTANVLAAMEGWKAPELEPWLVSSLNTASQRVFAQPFAQSGLGGSIPFFAMLSRSYPNAQFVVSGVLGPASNAHSIDELLAVHYAMGLTDALSTIIKDHGVARNTE